jgi:chromosome segregation ATPase
MERAREVADEALRRVEEIGQAHASNMERLQQQIAALRGERETLRDGLAAVQASVSGQLDSAAEIEELRAQLAPLADVQARQQELVDVVGRVAAAADDAAGRIVATETAQQAAVEAVRQQLAAAQADRDSLRGVLATMQSDLARAIGSDGELGALWQSVAPLVEAHARRQEFVSALSRAQDAAADALRRVAAIEKGQAGGLVDLERGIAELQTDRVKLDEAIERRFELLCGIIDAELEARIAPLEARITELRADEGADSGDAARQAPDDSLIGRVSSMALTRRKAHSRYKRGN